MNKTTIFPLSAPAAYGCAALSGVLYWLAFPGIDAWPFAFVAWVPLVVALHGQSARRAMLLGWVAGLMMNVAGFWWLQGMLTTFSGFHRPHLLPLSPHRVRIPGRPHRTSKAGSSAGRPRAAGPTRRRSLRRSRPVSSSFRCSSSGYFAATVHQVPVLSQTADLGGPILVGLVLVAVNVALAEAIIARLERRRVSIPTLATGAAVLAVACAYGALRIHQVDVAAQAAPAATVGVIQANMGLTEKRSSFDEGLRRHLTLSEEAREQGADFVVWSETSAMRPVRDGTYADELRGVSTRIGLPAIFGAVIVKRVPDERGYVLFNSAVSSDARGVINGRYDKEFLLTFGEYLPFGETFPILYRWSPNSGHFSPGTSLDPLIVDIHGDKHPVSALICYEDILPRFTNDAVRHADPELIVNLTNDAWFGDTAAPWEHFALTQLRAVEHRRYFVRGTNSGVSAVVDPVGRVVAHSSTFHTESLVAPIHWMRSHTVYEWLGDWPWLLISGGMIYAAFRRRRETAGRLAPAPSPES